MKVITVKSDIDTIVQLDNEALVAAAAQTHEDLRELRQLLNLYLALGGAHDEDNLEKVLTSTDTLVVRYIDLVATLALRVFIDHSVQLTDEIRTYIDVAEELSDPYIVRRALGQLVVVYED